MDVLSHAIAMEHPHSAQADCASEGWFAIELEAQQRDILSA